MEELKKEDTRFAQIQITIIDEEQEREKAAQMDYYYVPTFFLDGKKLHEGPASKDIVRSFFQKALE